MNLIMFIIGFVIFSVYVYFTIWNIFNSTKKQREENYPTKVDMVDMDGHGNYGRFPNETKKPRGFGKFPPGFKEEWDTSRVGQGFMFTPKKQKDVQ